MPRGQKLVVQMVETFREHMQPAFVETLDAWKLAEQAGMAIPPVMIYGDDVTHILTEEGIANLLLCRSDEEREQAIRGVAGYTPVGLARDRRMVENLRDRGVIRRAEDLGIDKRDATRNLLAARSMQATWCARRAGCTSRRSAFATGRGGSRRWKTCSSNSTAARRPGPFAPVLVGVVGSGNLEVLIEPRRAGGACSIEVRPSARGFGAIWEAVLRDFHARHPLAGVAISINDMGATPAVVSLRLDQAAAQLERADEHRHERSYAECNGARAHRPAARRRIVRRDPAAGASA